MRQVLLSLLLYSNVVIGYKFLVFNPAIQRSHVNFMSHLSDALVEAGHEVVMVTTCYDPAFGPPKTAARVIESCQGRKMNDADEKPIATSKTLNTLWQSSDVFSQIDAYQPMVVEWARRCGTVLADRELIAALQAEQFDAAFTEIFDSCGYGLFDMLGIQKYATTITVALLDGLFSVTQIPANTAYVPSLMGGTAGDRMSFFERLWNTLTYLKFDGFLETNVDIYQELFDRTLRNSPNIQELMRNSSLIFMNSDPLADFPKLTSARVIDIGGISVHSGHGELDQYWSDILALRKHTVLLSFGSFTKSHLMPDAFKKTILETVRKFPEVTFIWKYEKPEHNISAGLPNLVETTWSPQHDLLHDPRLSAFITHGGQNSITEAAGAGIPLICIPITADQWRNARQVERNGVGVMVNKMDLGRMGPLEEAIAKVLSDKSYKSNAVTLAEMIADRPFSMKDVFVRNMEFMAKHGPLRRFDHYSSELTFVQYYLLDIIRFFIVLGICALLIAVYSLKLVVGLFSGIIVTKKAKIQ